MIIDSHQHVFWHGRDDAGLIADMDDHGIDVSWLLSWEIIPQEDHPSYHRVLNPVHFRADGTHAGIVLSDLLLARSRYPKRFVVGYCPHPTATSAPARFEAAVEMHGVRVCGEWKFRIPFDDPRSLEIFRVAGRLKCPVVLHLDIPFGIDAQGKRIHHPMWYGGTVENLERALRAAPRRTSSATRLDSGEVSGNADTDPSTYPNGPVTPGGKLYDLLDRYPNLYADLSAGSGRTALARDPVHAVQFIHRYADRLLFGRDYYGKELHATLQSFNLSESDLKKIYYQNANGLVPSPV